ncbi:NTP transferase domain-containing protein [Yoonia sp. 76]|nr:NTP transferase domain-containing protein [Yoonia sp. 76]
MVNVEAIILCGGEAVRWANHMGVPKHLVPIDSVPLLHNTLAKLRQSGITRIVIAGRGEDYHLPQTGYLDVPQETCTAPADKFNSSRALWSKSGLTALLFGDVFFSDAAIATLRQSQPDAIAFLGRLTGSRITGCASPEIFALTFGPLAHHVLDDALAQIATAPTARPTGWQLYNILADKAAVGDLPVPLRLTFNHVDDLTEDFDFPEDYQHWQSQRAKAGQVRMTDVASDRQAAQQRMKRVWQVRAQLALLVGFLTGVFVTLLAWLVGA